MDFLIPDSWLRDFLKTKATPKQIGEALSLCGPSVERIKKIDGDSIYSIEVTTNRVDSASVFGIAREAASILPVFNIAARLIAPNTKVSSYQFKKSVSYLNAQVDPKLCSRFTAVLVKNVKISPSNELITKRLNSVGIRAINNVVDISNYLMIELGQPVHTFDYDKIMGSKMFVRESKKGEELTTLDGKNHKLLGGDIVIQDSEGLIDLAGIMGGENSAVTQNTKNILLFVQTYNPVNIRKTSMSLAHRTDAAVLFEKNLDPEQVKPTILRGIELFEKYTGGKAEKEILDIYPKPYKTKKVSTSLEFINKILGVEVKKQQVTKILSSLGFSVKWSGGQISLDVPSFRSNDVEIEEDVAEEVARIYGYHKLPPRLMEGALPQNPPESTFRLESEIKQILKGYGGTEVYTLSMVSKDQVDRNALKIKNALGGDAEYLRTSLMPSLVNAYKSNAFEQEPFHLFEIANVYIPKLKNLPEEKMLLAGIFSEYDFREAKGIIKSLLYELNVYYLATPEDSKHFKASQRLVYKSKTGEFLGELGTLENDLIYYEFSIEKLQKLYKDVSNFKPIPKFPPQIEDLTFILPEKTKLGEVLSFIKKVSPLVKKVELRDTYKDAVTFRVYYQHSQKTLTDEEVIKLRDRVLESVKQKFGGETKD